MAKSFVNTFSVTKYSITIRANGCGLFALVLQYTRQPAKLRSSACEVQTRDAGMEDDVVQRAYVARRRDPRKTWRRDGDEVR